MSFVGSFNLLTVLKVVKISQCSGQSSAANFLGAVLFWPSCKLASIEHLCDLNYSKMREPINLPEMYWLESLTQSVYVCSASQTQVKATSHTGAGCFIFHTWTRWLHLTWQQLLVRVNLPDDAPLIYVIQVQKDRFWATRCTDLWKNRNVGPLGRLAL